MRTAGGSSYQTNEWVFIDYRMAGVYRRLRQSSEANGLIDRITRRAPNHFYLLPEMYNNSPDEGPIGEYAGSIPMVGYGAGAFYWRLWSARDF